MQIHVTVVYPGITRYEIKYSLGKKSQEVSVFFDGTTGWQITNGSPTEMNEARKKEVRASMFRELPNLLGLIGGPTVSYQGKSGDNDVLVFGLGDLSVRSHIDSTGQVVKLAYRATTGDVEQTLSDYREVGGVKMPYKISVTRNGRQYFDAQVTEAMANTHPNLEKLAQRPR
jgi:hypothetical protein